MEAMEAIEAIDTIETVEAMEHRMLNKTLFGVSCWGISGLPSFDRLGFTMMQPRSIICMTDPQIGILLM